MNETYTHRQHPRPPRLARILANTLVTIILRSRWHNIRSDRLLLLTFTGRKSRKTFTTPVRYVQEDETLRMTVIYPWWKNLITETTVHVLLRGRTYSGNAEVHPKKDGEAVVKIHLQG